MNPSNIVRVGAVCTALFVGACGFSPGKGASGSGGSSSGIGGINITGTGGRTTGQGGLTGTGGGSECGAFDQPSTKLPPDILIVLDASGSMNQDANNADCANMCCGAMSKWALMTPALNTVVGQTETEVNWGLKFFADQGSCGVNNNAAVNIALMNAAPIATAIMGRTAATGCVSNGSSTPTRAAEEGAVNYLGGLTSPNPKFIVLATDGQPNCRAGCSGTQACGMDDTPGAVAAVTAARTAGFRTFVVGISAPAGAANDALNMMAVEGGFPQVGQPTQYYAVSNTAEFAAVLRTLVGMATTCTFTVPPPPTNDGTTSRGDIDVKGTDASGGVVIIPPDATNGWTYTDANMTNVILHGSACAAVEAGTYTSVTIVFHCHIP
jgi:von Willebrand factor type A domain-containing protein